MNAFPTFNAHFQTTVSAFMWDLVKVDSIRGLAHNRALDHVNFPRCSLYPITGEFSLRHTLHMPLVKPRKYYGPTNPLMDGNILTLSLCLKVLKGKSVLDGVPGSKAFRMHRSAAPSSSSSSENARTGRRPPAPGRISPGSGLFDDRIY